jgi:DNA repair protein RadC
MAQRPVQEVEIKLHTKPGAILKAQKTYTVQKYSMTYVREPDHQATKERRRIMHRDDVKEFCVKYFSDMPIEHCIVIALDNGNHIIGFTVFEGIQNQAAIYPSAIFRFLLSAAATSFIIAHNHPGGTMSPSESDWKMTERLYRAGCLLEIPLMDHVIVSDETTTSLKDSSRWDWKERIY